ncbi:MAG: ribonuclease III family protein [Solirubrobacteraceae bacterium]
MPASKLRAGGASTEKAPSKRSGKRGSVKPLQALLDELPEDLARQVFAHASWTERRSDSYLRLAFLGDSVLGLAVTTHLYPRLEAEKFGAGRLTKIRAQTVSGRACRAVAERLGVIERLADAAPEEKGRDAVRGLATQRVLASVLEAVIGACYLHAGYERTAEAVVKAFVPEIENALENPVDCKSALQELLAQRGEKVKYKLLGSQGPAHKRIFEVAATVDGEALGTGQGSTKKDAEQTAAQEALERLAKEDGS